MAKRKHGKKYKPLSDKNLETFAAAFSGIGGPDQPDILLSREQADRLIKLRPDLFRWFNAPPPYG